MNTNRKNDTMAVLDRLKAQPNTLHYAKVVGRWIWIEFPSKPEADTREFLKAEGFIWNRKRTAWQHSCGFFSKNAPYDPRMKYGEVSAEELVAA